MPASPGTSRVVSVNSPPSASSTGPAAKAFMRISGPLVSSIVATAAPSSSRTWRSLLSVASWLSCVPCEKLKRAAFMPVRMSSRSFSSSSTEGPMVQIIFVFLKKVSSNIR